MDLGRYASDHWNAERNATWKNREARRVGGEFAFSYLSVATPYLRHREGLS